MKPKANMKATYQSMTLRKEQTKKLEEVNLRLQDQLERIKRFKELEEAKKQLQSKLKEVDKLPPKPTSAANGQKRASSSVKGIEKVHAVDIDTLTKKHEKLMLAARSSSRASGDQTSDPINTKLPEDGIGNIEYFLKVVKMEKYGELFQANNIKTLAELKKVKKEKFDELGLPLSDQVKLVKKLRDMGIS